MAPPAPPPCDQIPPGQDAFEYLKSLVKSRRGALSAVLAPQAQLGTSMFINDCDNTIQVSLSVPLHPSRHSARPRSNHPASSQFDLHAAASGPLGPIDEFSSDSPEHRHVLNSAARDLHKKIRAMANPVEIAACAELQTGLRSITEAWRTECANDSSRRRALRHARSVVNAVHAGSGLPGARVLAFGSATAGLAVGKSDLDVTICPPLVEGEPSNILNDDHSGKALRIRLLAALASAASRSHMEDVEIISKAKIPLLRYMDPSSDVSVDMSIANDGGVMLSRLFRQHISVDHRIWELCLTVKAWAKEYGVSGTKDGFLNPMGWVIMVIYFLQHGTHPPVAALFYTKGKDPDKSVIKRVPWASSSRDKRSTKPLHQLLVAFFQFYAFDFDYDSYIISLNLMRPTKRAHLANIVNNSPIFIEQPMELGVNVVPHVNTSSLRETVDAMSDAHRICMAEGNVHKLLHTPVCDSGGIETGQVKRKDSRGRDRGRGRGRGRGDGRGDRNERSRRKRSGGEHRDRHEGRGEKRRRQSGEC